jgi:hypothetical protein
VIIVDVLVLAGLAYVAWRFVLAPPDHRIHVTEQSGLLKIEVDGYEQGYRRWIEPNAPLLKLRVRVAAIEVMASHNRNVRVQRRKARLLEDQDQAWLRGRRR